MDRLGLQSSVGNRKPGQHWHVASGQGDGIEEHTACVQSPTSSTD